MLQFDEELKTNLFKETQNEKLLRKNTRFSISRFIK